MATAKHYDHYKSIIDDLPALFPVKTLAEVMGVNLTSAYELAGRQSFNCTLTIGKRILIVKEHFKKWLDNSVLCDEFVNGYKDLTDEEKELYSRAFWEAVHFLERQSQKEISRSENVKYLFDK